uniref:AdiponectinRec n=1 Tax=Hemiscolopendra marginata TaxID=943146 RepID=A0A646QCQ7_9MYRI
MTEYLEKNAALRERKRFSDALDLEVPEVSRLLEDDVSLSDGNGCQIPGTPEEDQLLDAQQINRSPRTRAVRRRIKEEVRGIVGHDDLDSDMSMASRAAEQAEQLVRKVWEASWKVTHFHSLPMWLQDNDFLVKGHRPPLPSFYACFKSIFRIHTETGNIWTHLLGCVAFIGVAAYFLTRPSIEIQWQEKAVFATFFAGAILCLGLSFTFHTVHCHSERVGKLFSKLDYCGIALLIIGSFVPWLYYGFYCNFQPKLIYLIVVVVLGVAAIVVSLWDKFSEPKFRSLRAGVFMGFGLSGVIPAIHYLIAEGFFKAVYHASLGWLILMGSLYILGAMLYALRVPERFFPGKCDIWFQSHQIFHILVIAAAFVHYHGISEMAMYRLTIGDCLDGSEEIIY